nr:hypothetical protein B296_00035561 [Ipomoea trifida]
MLIKLLAFPFSIRELVRSGEGFGLEVSAVSCVEVLGGVKPKVELLFSAASALSDDIGMEDVRFAGDISEELKIYFIMDTYIEGSNSAGRIPRNELHLHLNSAKKEIFLGPESRPRSGVERQGKKLTSIGYLGAIATPSHVKILVEIASRVRKWKGFEGKWKKIYSGYVEREREKERLAMKEIA